MAYPNTRTLRYKEGGKVWDGTFLEQSRVEIVKESIIENLLIAEGYSEADAAEVATILKTNEII